MRWLALILLVAGCATSVPQDSLQRTPETAHAVSGCGIVDVVDGDTIKIECSDGSGGNARLVGFDTPETFRPGCAWEKRLGEQATVRLRSLIVNAERLEFESVSGTDKYGRLLLRLIVDGEDVGNILVAEGLARRYDGGKRRGWCKGQIA